MGLTATLFWSDEGMTNALEFATKDKRPAIAKIPLEYNIVSQLLNWNGYLMIGLCCEGWIFN